MTDDAIEIQDVTFLLKDQEWGDFDYSVQGSIMDGVCIHIYPLSNVVMVSVLCNKDI